MPRLIVVTTSPSRLKIDNFKNLFHARSTEHLMDNRSSVIWSQFRYFDNNYFRRIDQQNDIPKFLKSSLQHTILCQKCAGNGYTNSFEPNVQKCNVQLMFFGFLFLIQGPRGPIWVPRILNRCGISNRKSGL